MSVHVTSYIWKHSKQAGTRLVMMLSIADRCDDNGGCFPGQRDLADRAKLMNTKSVSAIVNQLSADGELTIVRRNGHSNYYFVREYCIVNEINLEEILGRYGLKGPLEIVGGWSLDNPPSDDDPTPPQIVDDPSSDDDPTPPQIVDDPSSDEDIESSVKSSVFESSVESPVESSSSKSDDEEDFGLTDKELSIVREAFGGSVTTTAKQLLEKDCKLTFGWSEYALATRRCYDDDDKRYVRTPSRYIGDMVSKGENVPELPVESETRRKTRELAEEQAKYTDADWAIKTAAEEKEAEARLAEFKKAESERKSAKKAGELAAAEVDRLESDRLKTEAERDAKLWFDKIESERQERKIFIQKKLEETGGDRQAIVDASYQLFKRIIPSDAAKCGEARKKWHQFIFGYYKRQQFSDSLRLIDYIEEEIVRDDGSLFNVKVPVAIYSYMTDGLKKVLTDKPEPFIRIMSVLQYHEMHAQKGTKDVG